MKPPAREAATLITRALLSAWKSLPRIGTWSPSLEHTLHQLGLRDSLTPSLVARVIDPHLLHHPSLSLGFFNWAAQQPNFSHSSTSYNSLLKSLSISRHFGSLEKLLREAKSRRFEVDPVIYRRFIESLVKSKRSREAYLVWSEVGDVREDVCNLVLGGLVSDGHFECARKVFDEMLVRGFTFSTLGFGLFLWRYCRSAQICDVLGLLGRVRGGFSAFDGSIVALLIVHGLCEVGRVSEAYGCLEELRNSNCKPDFMAYRIVAEAYRSMGPGSIFEVQLVLKRKRKLGVAPRASDYKDFIFALLSDNFIHEAKVLGQIIVEGSFPVEDDVLNALIESVSKVDPCSAMLFFRFMMSKDSTPTLLTLRNLSRNLYQHKKIDYMLDVFQTLSTKDYFMDLESYYLKVSSLCEAGRVKEAYETFQEMRNKGLVPHVDFYNALTEALCHEDLIRPAKKLWDEMFACGVNGNLKTYNLLIKKFAETGLLEKAHSLFDHMLQKDVMPDTTTYTSLLEGCYQDSQIEAAIQFFYKAADQDVAIAKAVVTPLLLFLCGGGHFMRASQLLCCNCNLKHTDSHVILLKYLSDSKEFQIAIDHLKHIMALSPSLLHELSTEIFALLASSSNPEPTLQLLREMQLSELTSTDENWKRFCGQVLKWIPGGSYLNPILPS